MNINPVTHWKVIQAALGTTRDGIPGPNDEAAFYTAAEAAHAAQEGGAYLQLGPYVAVMTGRGLRVYIIAEDLFMFGVRGTCFGGTNDPQDSGETASGISTKPPGTLGVALPRNYCGSDQGTYDALCGSPIPEGLPWETPVEITELSSGIQGVYTFIDLGPNLETTDNAVDLTVAAAQDFDPNASATNFEIYCDVRIIGGARYL